MKTYEEMARDVLRRRDEELLNIQTADTTALNDVTLDVATPAVGRRHGLKRILIPGAAAVTAAAVGLTIWHNAGLLNKTSCESGDYWFSDFSGSPTQNPVIGEVMDYPGGETEINITRLKEADYYNDFFYKVKDVHQYFYQIDLNTDDFIAVSDDEINGFYGIEFDRFTKQLDGWDVEHEPFGYYSRDEETSDIVSHQPHGYYSKNRISYFSEAGENIEVIAEFSDTFWSKVFSKTDQKSIINGFDAVIYGLDGGDIFNFSAYLTMNGVPVYIGGTCICEKRFIEMLDIFTSRSSDIKNYPVDIVNILDRKPAELTSETDPFAAEPPSEIEGVYFVRWTLDDMNDHFGYNTNKLGKLYSTWKVSGTKSLGEYSNERGAWCTVDEPPKIHYDVNTLYYASDDGVDVELSITHTAMLPSCDGSSYINGYYAIIFRDSDPLPASESINQHDSDARERFGAYIMYGNTTVKIFAAGLSDSEFTDVIKAFTTPLEEPEEKEEPSGNVYNIHNDVPNYLIENKHGFFNGHCITDDVSFVPYTKEELNALYGIELDRFGKLHEDWEESVSGELGVYVYDYQSAESSRISIGGHKIAKSLNVLCYRTADEQQDIYVNATLIGEPEDMFSPFSGFFPEPGLFSLINDKTAYIWRHDGDRVSGNHSAIIKMGKTLVMISMNDVPEKDFLNLLNEFTADNGSDAEDPVSTVITDRIPYKVYNTADPFDDRITYSITLSEGKISYNKTSEYEAGAQTEGSAAALGYLKNFFGTEELPIDKAYKDNIIRYQHDANFECRVAPNTIASSPVDGKVIAASDDNGALGKTVAVEFVDNVFILYNLDRVSVKAGDRITSGQELGVCGTTEDGACLSMLLMKITDLRP